MQDIVLKLKSAWDRIPRQVKAAFITALIAGFLTHMYTMTNLFPNSDGILSSFAVDKDMIGQGRWFQRYAMLLSSPYNMPWVNGIISVLMLSFSAGLVVSATGVKSVAGGAVAALFMVTFPTLASSYTYMYMADGFTAALLLAAAAVYIANKYNKWGFLFASLLLCLSLGVYQAYICFAAALCVVILIMDILGKEYTGKQILIKGLKFAAALAIGAALYYAIVLVTLKVSGSRLTSYQNINRMGVFSLGEFFGAVIMAFKGFFNFIRYTSGQFSVAAVAAHYILLAACAFMGVVLLIKKKIWKNPLRLVLLVLMTGLLPIALNSAYLLMAEAVHSLMVYSLSAFFILAVLLFEEFEEGLNRKTLKSAASWIFLALAAVIVFESFIYSNKIYYVLQTNYIKTYSYSIRVSERVEESPQYERGMPVAFIGYSTSEGFLTVPTVGAGQGNNYLTLSSRHYNAFFKDYMSLDFEQVSLERIDELHDSQKFSEMPVYPAQGCVDIIDGVLVVKLGEYENFYN